MAMLLKTLELYHPTIPFLFIMLFISYHFALEKSRDVMKNWGRTNWMEGVVIRLRNTNKIVGPGILI